TEAEPEPLGDPRHLADQVDDAPGRIDTAPTATRRRPRSPLEAGRVTGLAHARHAGKRLARWELPATTLTARELTGGTPTPRPPGSWPPGNGPPAPGLGSCPPGNCPAVT